MRIDDDRAAIGEPRSRRSGRRGQGPTSKDVARVAGVSQSTVSYVMSGKRSISERTRQQVLAAIAELTYEPHAGARALAGHRTQVVGLVMPFLDAHSSSGLMAFTEQIALSARERDHDVLMLTSQEGPAGLARVSRRALCDAAVVMEVTLDDPRAALARDLAMPIIFIGIPDDHDGLHCIDFDFAAGAELLVDELADAGATSVAAIAWHADRERSGLNFVPRFRDRAQERCRERGLELQWYHVASDGSDVDRVVEAVLDAPQPPALLVTQALTQVNGALQRRGLVPGVDLDLVALSTDAEAEVQIVPSTAVSTQPRDVSRRAMSWLFDLLDGDAPAELRLVEATLTRRSSVRPHTP